MIRLGSNKRHTNGNLVVTKTSHKMANKKCRKFWKFVKKLKKCDHYELVPISAGVASWSQPILYCETNVVSQINKQKQFLGARTTDVWNQSPLCTLCHSLVRGWKEKGIKENDFPSNFPYFLPLTSSLFCCLQI